MECWYVAKVKPQKEKSLISFLSVRGVEVFFPTIIQPSRTGPRMKPLFPTYLFCHLDTESSIWPVVRWAPGMSYFLNHDGKSIPVPNYVVENLQQRVPRVNRTTSCRPRAAPSQASPRVAAWASLRTRTGSERPRASVQFRS